MEQIYQSSLGDEQQKYMRRKGKSSRKKQAMYMT